MLIKDVDKSGCRKCNRCKKEPVTEPDCKECPNPLKKCPEGQELYTPTDLKNCKRCPECRKKPCTELKCAVTKESCKKKKNFEWIEPKKDKKNNCETCGQCIEDTCNYPKCDEKTTPKKCTLPKKLITNERDEEDCLICPYCKGEEVCPT